MGRLKKMFVTLGIILLVIVVINKIFISHHLLMGVKLLNLVVLANSCFALAVLIKLHQKQ